MNKIVVIGYKNTDALYNEIQDGIKFDSKIGLHSFEGKVIKSAATNYLKANKKLMSHYRRVYVLIGDSITEQLSNQQARFMKKLKGELLVDILYEADIELLDIIREEIKAEQLSRNTSNEMLRLSHSFNNIEQRFAKDLKRFQKMNDPSRNFGATKWGLRQMEHELQKFIRWADKNKPLPNIRERALNRWYALGNE